MEVYKSLISESEQMKQQITQQMPPDPTDLEEPDFKEPENTYDNISKNYPLLAVNFQTVDGSLQNGHGQSICFIPNEAAFKEAIKGIVQWSQNTGYPLKTDKKNMLYYGDDNGFYEEIYFIEASKKAGAGAVWFPAKELNEYQPLRTKWDA